MSIMLGYFDAISVSTKLDIFNKYTKQKELYFPNFDLVVLVPTLNQTSTTVLSRHKIKEIET